MKKTTKLNLTQLRICPVDSGLNPEIEFSNNRWNLRHSFPLTVDMDFFAVQMTFTKELFSTYDDQSIRRKITISIINPCENDDEVYRASFYIVMGKGIYQKCYRKDIELNYFDISQYTELKVIVTNETENRRLGMYDLRLIDLHEIEERRRDWVNITSGVLGDHDTHYLRTTLSKSPCCPIRFLASSKFDLTSEQMAEFEIRLHHPNGMIESSICIPKCGHYACAAECYFITIIENFAFHTKGVHYAELVCLGIPVAGFLFEVGDVEQEGNWDDIYNLDPIDNYTPQKGEKLYHEHVGENDFKKEEMPSNSLDIEFDMEQFNELADEVINNGHNAEEDNNETVVKNVLPEEAHESSWNKLGELTGLSSVKEKLYSYRKTIEFTNLRERNGLPTFKMPLHSMFLGAPGTGKTTIAKALGEMLAETGVLSSGHVVVRERSTLIGKYYSSEEENTIKAIEEAQGGILFIDEAYQLLAENDPRDPGRHVINALLTALSDESKRDWMLILAGYPEQTLRLYDLNPGLKSRIPESNIYTFNDFSESELMEIAENYLTKNQYSLTDDARKALLLKLGADYNTRDKNFGNARHVINLFQTTVFPSMAARIMESGSDTDLTTIIESDIPKPSTNSVFNQRRVGFHP